MNRMISTVILVAALTGLTACSSNDDDNGGGNPPPASGSPSSGGSSDPAGTGDNTTGGNTQPADNAGGSGGADGTGAGAGGGGGATGTSPPTGTTTTSAARNISNAPATNAEIATDASGNAIAVWRQHDGTRNNIFYSRFTGGAWGTAALLENLDGDAAAPRIAMNNAGNAMAVWTQVHPDADDSADAVFTWGRYFDVAAGWGEPTLVNRHTYSRGGFPSDFPTNHDPRVAIDDSGIAIATWIEYSLRVSAAGMVANVYRPGSGWGNTTHLLSRSYSAYPDIAMDGRGNGVVAYALDGGGSYGYETYAAYYSAANGWGESVRVKAGEGGDSDVSVGMDSAGNATMVWSHWSTALNTANTADIFASRLVPGGGWSAPALIEYDAGSARFADIAVANNGNAVVVWEHHSDTGINIRSVRYENSAWQLPVTIGSGIDPHVAMSGNGPYATYVNNDTVMSARWNGSGWDAPVALESHAEISGYPRIAGSAYATPFFAWLQRSGVWARRLP